MAAGRIRRSARRGIAVAVLGWLGAASLALVMAPSASAAPTATIEIKNLTPPAAAVDPGGTVTFVNKIPGANRGGISIPLPLGSVTVSATVYTDVAVKFFDQEKKLQLDQSVAWAFTAPATTGTITYTYRVVPQAGLPVGVSAQTVVNRTLAGLPPLPAPTPYVVQTVAPNVPNLPSVNLPQLPQLNVQLPTLPTDPGTQPVPTGPGGNGGPVDIGGSPADRPSSIPGDPYAYQTGRGAPQLSPSDIAAAAAFDPAGYFGSGARGSGSSAGGSGGAPGSYDGASVPVFGQLAGLDGGSLDDQAATTSTAAEDSAAGQTLPAAALAAVVALAAVTAALVRTHQASRASR